MRPPLMLEISRLLAAKSLRSLKMSRHWRHGVEVTCLVILLLPTTLVNQGCNWVAIVTENNHRLGSFSALGAGKSGARPWTDGLHLVPSGTLALCSTVHRHCVMVCDIYFHHVELASSSRALGKLSPITVTTGIHHVASLFRWYFPSVYPTEGAQRLNGPCLNIQVGYMMC